LTLLRRDSWTVDDLARELDLTDNAVRSHLTGLERDGLVEQGERVRGVGKPAFSYKLTSDADTLFPKAYATLVQELLTVFAERMPPEALTEALQEVGHRLAAEQPAATGDVRQRAEQAAAVLGTLGGLADVEEADGNVRIKGFSCPLAAAVETNPDACCLAEAMLADVIGLPVRQQCDQGPPPRCRFVILADGE
jgi:predicted ArsR family transcriptional regulator